MEKHYIGFTKTALPYGWLGNMAAFPIEHEGRVWRTSEALFQSMRFEDDAIKEQIRLEKSPMGAKFKAKAHRDRAVLVSLSREDVANMEFCVRLKLETHPELKTWLKETGNAILFEDVSSRPRGNNLFWGAVLRDEELVGENVLGKIWMQLRASL